MREIKFRIYDEITSNPRMIRHNDLFNMTLDGKLRYGNADFAKEYKLMQYTGFKDRNGVEIYEGDIVELKYHRDRRYKVKAKVEYGKWEGSFILKYEDNLTTEEYPLYKITANNYLEVIGNIYENKELLNQ